LLLVYITDVINLIMRVILTFLLLFSFNQSFAKSGAGVEGGVAWGDIGAEETAQRIANLSGSTTTVTYDQATFYGRLFYEYEINRDSFIDVGYFLTGSLDATYTLSGASATEGYSFNGLEGSYGFKSDGFYFKGGIHQSEVDGKASVTIGGTTYAAKASASGTGFLFGGGVEEDLIRWGLTYYDSVGGIEDANLLVLFYGVKF